jgi:hypothetical protein
MKLRFYLAVACVGLSQFLSLSLIHQPLPAVADAVVPPAQSAAAEQLLQMFSPQIQATINACAERGKVNLSAGATSDGSVTCADGSPNSAVTYADYLTTISDILAASVLVGVRAAMANDPRITPEMVTAFLASSQGSSTLRGGIQAAIMQNQLLPADQPESVALLTDTVITRVTPTLQDPAGLDMLFGTSEQYSQVVDSFCTPPGMSVSQVQALLPDVSSIQLYAICVQESGITEEILRMAR